MLEAAQLLLREGERNGVPVTRRQERPRERERPPGILACVRCGQAITTRAAACQRAGGHEHTFANPHGFLFRIGCFQRAAGCSPTGIPTREHTWFPAYAWRVDLCAACGDHLGWLFLSDDDAFHGLILDRLVERDG